VLRASSASDDVPGTVLHVEAGGWPVMPCPMQGGP
jgi:hypothetical protein